MPDVERDTPCGLHLFWDDAVTAYDFGPGHPMDPTRLALTKHLVDAFGLGSGPGVTVRSAPAAGDSTLRLVHTAEYIAAVRRVAADPGLVDLRHGLGTGSRDVVSDLFPRVELRDLAV